MKAAKKYRLLRAGEVVRKGDHYNAKENELELQAPLMISGWLDTTELVGMTVSPWWLVHVRRAIKRKPAKRAKSP